MNMNTNTNYSDIKAFKVKKKLRVSRKVEVNVHIKKKKIILKALKMIN